MLDSPGDCPASSILWPSCLSIAQAADCSAARCLDLQPHHRKLLALRAGFLKHEAALRPLLDEIWPVLCGAVSYGKVSVATVSGAAQVLPGLALCRCCVHATKLQLDTSSTAIIWQSWLLTWTGSGVVGPAGTQGRKRARGAKACCPAYGRASRHLILCLQRVSPSEVGLADVNLHAISTATGNVNDPAELLWYPAVASPAAGDAGDQSCSEGSLTFPVAALTACRLTQAA